MADKTEQQRRTEKYLANVSREIDSAIHANLETKAGRALLWWLLEIGRVNTQPFSATAERTAFACGELNVGQQILARIVELNPDGYIAMMKEKQDGRRSLSDPGSGGNSLSGSYDGPVSDERSSRDDSGAESD